MVDVAPILGPYIARPPTPPRESSVKLSRDTALLNGASASHSLLDTPEESPASSAEYFKDSSGKARKKVGFSGWTQYHQPSPIGFGSGSQENRKKLPPSRECNPTKPILKRYPEISSVDSKENIPIDTGDLPAMLRSAASHLAGNIRSSKIDAYNSLLGCLNIYDDVPNSQELAEKVIEISGFIRRDIFAKNIDGTIDTQLAAQALKLITVLHYTKGTTSLIPEEFCLSIFEQSIKCLEDPTSPKIMVTHYMHLLEKQKFSHKILVPDRLNRLMAALASITRVKGNRIICSRMNIYLRLLTQARNMMISRTGSWIDHLISGMLSSLKDVRGRAIAFGLEAGLQIGTVSSVSQDCINAFNRQSPEGTKVVEYVESRLKEMTKSKEDGPHVPQAWSVIVLLLRGRSLQIERWEHLKPWLTILQQCFNSSDAQIKFQANIAWNRFIFAVDLGMSTSISLAKMLKQPIISQLERKSSDKNAKQAKQIARSSYCTLLNYALRPTATHAQLNHYWELYVVDLLPKAFAETQADIEYACDILSNLFFNPSQPKIWDSNKANATGPMKPGDLLPLDTKWLRSKTESIIAIFEKLLEVGEWVESENSSLVLLWQSFTSALGNASSKEVKVSLSTMTATAKILDFLKGFLLPNRTRVTGFDKMKMFNTLLKDAVAKIGYIPFNEKRLLLTQSNQYEAVAETPSSRGSSTSASLDSAAAHLLNLLLDTHDDQVPYSRQAAFDTAVRINLHNISSRRGRLQALRSIGRHPSFDASTPPMTASLELWTSLAVEATITLGSSRTPELHGEDPEYPGHEYRDVVKILELGVRLHSLSIHGVWTNLLECLCRVLSKEVGGAAIILIISEPLAEVIRREVLGQFDEVVNAYAFSCLNEFLWPGDSRIVEHVQVKLWGMMPVRYKSDLKELLDPNQRLISALLEAAYASIMVMGEEASVRAIIMATKTMIRLPQEYRRRFIADTQQAMGLWIEDSENVISRHSDVFTKVHQMHGIVKASLESSPTFDNTFLSQYHEFFISCFKSRHKAILNQSILLWNNTVGSAEDIIYPEDLQKLLFKLRAITNIQLPGFLDSANAEDVSSPLNVVDSSDSEDESLRNRIVTPKKTLAVKQNSPRYSTPSKFHAESPLPVSASRGSSRPQSARRDVKTTPKAKLRHDNSQIQFAAIESSPIAEDPCESQQLTERQREVKERQKQESALFPEIRSSPRTDPPIANHRLPTLALNSSAMAGSLREDEAISPSFPPDTMMNDFLGSSPTPSSHRKKAEEPFSDDGPPSSPPLMGSHLQIEQTKPSNRTPRIDADEHQEEHMNEMDGHNETSTSILPQAKSVDGHSASTNVKSTRNDLAAPDTNHNNVDSGILSDVEVFVDAPTNQKLIIEGLVTEKDMAHSPRSSRTSTENDEVTAQLMSEIAEASSQLSRLPQLNIDVAGRDSKKRTAKSSGGPRKRTKSASSSGEVVADCVLIDSRPRSSGIDTARQHIKHEPSASPQPGVITTNAPNETSRAGETRKGLKRISSEGDKSEGPKPSAKRTRIKGEQDINRRSERTKRTSSRLSDVATSSPVVSESSYASPQQPGIDVGWVSGPRGSSWQWVPATAPFNASEPPADPPSPTTAVDDGHEAVALPITLDVTHAQTSNLEVGPEEDGEAPTPSGILEGFRTMLENVKKVALRPEEERAMVGFLFESVQEVHEAGRRYRTL